MNYQKLNDIYLNNYVITSDTADYPPISVADTATSGVKVANIQIDGQDNDLYVTKEALSTELDLSSYMRKDELSNYLSVVDEPPSPECQAANPLVFWFVKKRT